MSRIPRAWLIVSIFLLVIPLFSSVSLAWWDDNWQYRRPVTIDNTGNSNTLTDYQKKVELDSSNFDFSKANSDGSDIRFVDSDDTTELSYWIEDWDSSGQEATIWVKVPSIPASSTKTIYMYYGNENATSESNKTNTFSWVESFESFNNGDNIDENGWTYEYSATDKYVKASIDTAHEGTKSAKVVGASGQTYAKTIYFFGSNYPVTTSVGYLRTSWVKIPSTLTSSDNFKLGFGRITNGTSVAQIVISGGDIPADNSWHKVELYIRNGDIRGYVDGSLVESSTTSLGGDVHLDFEHIYVGWDTSGTVYIDDFIMRKYTDPEPTITIGSEELPNQPPTITITSPENTTYYTTQLNLNFSVTDDSSTTFHVKAWLNDTLLYDNSSYNNGTDVGIDLSSYITSTGSYYVKVWANDTDSSTPQTAEEEVYFSVENNPPEINVSSPINGEDYNTLLINLTFNVVDDQSSTFIVRAYSGGTLIYNNTSYQNNTEVNIQIDESTLSLGNNTIRIEADDNYQTIAKQSEENITFTISPNINITSPTGYYVTLFNNLSIPINFTAGVEGYSGTFNALVYADGSLVENITNYANNDERSIDYTWDTSVHDHNVTIKLISGSNEWEETSEFTIQYGNIISHVYDEQSAQLVRKPILLTMTDGINEYKFAWGESFDSYNNSGMDVSNLQYVCDMDTDTYGHLYYSGSGASTDVYCYVALKPGEVNNMKIKLNTDGMEIGITAYNTITDSWDTVYSNSETNGVTQTKSFTINNTESEYDGRIKIHFHAWSSSDSTGDIYEIYNEDGVSYLNVTDVHFTNDIITLIYDDGDSNDDYYRRVYHYNISELEDYTFNAYMLELTKGITYTFYVKDFIGSPITNAFVTIEKFINGDYRPVEIGLTDTAGKVTMWVDPLVTYQLLVYASGYGNLTATFEPDISTRVSEIHLTGNVEELDINQYNPVYGIEITRTEGIFQEAGTMVYVNVTETSSNMVSSYIKVTEIGFNYSNTTYTDTCSNSHSCEFYFNLSKPSKRYDVELYVTRYENGTEVTREFNFEYITRGSGWLDINIDETGRSLWMFIWLILTLAILSVSYRFLGVASLSLIFVMTALGYFLGIYTLGEVILISIVLLIVLKMVI